MARLTTPRAARLRRGDVSSDYDRDGYLILESALDRALVSAVRAEATAICRGARGDIDGAARVHPHEAAATALARYLCIHFPHKISPLMAEVARLPAVVDVLTTIVGPNVKMMQSMLFIKAAGKPGQAWHQDEAHIPTRDRSLTAAWIALDDATVDNGCLWVLPGSHRAGVLHAVRHHDDPRFDHTPEAYGFEHRHTEAVPVEVPAGSVLFFDGYLLHRSLPNTRRQGLRRALVNHYMSAESLLPWQPPTGQEPMGTLDHRDIVLVAGRDPHGAKGVTDVMRPRLREERPVGSRASRLPEG